MADLVHPTDTAGADVPDCQSCGACCAFSWEWPALIGFGDGAGIPPHLIEDGRMRCEGNRCAALAGTLGEDVHCTVYADRPLVCREFASGSEDCLAVRRHFGFG
ncbi:YkgJ family cysteine cluster protein [Arenibaculum pallidiluteum]|uniref:YkgJ family cysteine cluster protein n=1 Tax=Arenibaculum pallidiluteum TaxID=2812559 RepID=UPI002E2AFF4D|nr:YkgJ family cysteine cluster protein [Arenibaculum pallidiluteum]